LSFFKVFFIEFSMRLVESRVSKRWAAPRSVLGRHDVDRNASPVVLGRKRAVEVDIRAAESAVTPSETFDSATATVRDTGRDSSAQWSYR